MSTKPPTPTPHADTRLIIQSYKDPCNVGVVSGKSPCPLFDDDTPIAERLEAIKAVMHRRIAERSAAR